nr:SDR family oxidoreductase [uncultured Blautia sp.]
MSGLLKDKVCLITGASRGIGKATALLFAEEGAKVIVNVRRQGSAEKWIEQSSYREQLEEKCFDITLRQEVQNNILEIKKKYGSIDVLVNNAGIEFNELIGMISEENTRKMFEVNVFGMINMIQTVSRIMRRNERGGSIINISSMTALRGNIGQMVYSATKGAVISMTRSAAKELAAGKIRVNSIAPGLTRTEMMMQTEEVKMESRIQNIMLGRIAEPEDIAGACLLLASDYADYISGQVLSADGCSIM